ncbi:hypothetical protein A33M_2820 [Rhodovulum sp. PH10]|nr:hypothetical protein A33M_2820 [Rhodovulum sp. PH10]
MDGHFFYHSFRAGFWDVCSILSSRRGSTEAVAAASMRDMQSNEARPCRCIVECETLRRAGLVVRDAFFERPHHEEKGRVPAKAGTRAFRTFPRVASGSPRFAGTSGNTTRTSLKSAPAPPLNPAPPPPKTQMAGPFGPAIASSRNRGRGREKVSC